MKVDIYRCDGCHCEDKADGTAKPCTPGGWYHVITWGADGAKQEAHLCGTTCLMEYATKQYGEAEKDGRR